MEQSRSDISVTGMVDSEEQVGGVKQSVDVRAEFEVRETVDAEDAEPEPSNGELMAIMRLTLRKGELMNIEVKDSRNNINAV